ncbi:YibE/F family protein [Corynebacterium qintianiae]|uniref:YibE/F family protein n=2 Tax=Corynebacterium qintianiae TaxID=2709392 RepID=A0A7T0PEJ1_9CORY|nr:YibE/F family protein [Corynebacterium qintianiae]
MGRHAAGVDKHRENGGSGLVQRVLAGSLATAFVLTVIGLVLLWPRGGAPAPEAGFRESQSVAAEGISAVVVSTSPAECNHLPATDSRLTRAQPGFVEGGSCSVSEVRITVGPDEGRMTTLQNAGSPGDPHLAEGDKILLARSESPDGASTYTFLDVDRAVPLWVWIASTVLGVIAAAAWRGARALVGLVFTLAVIGMFLVPALVRGGPPVMLAVVAGAAILFPVIFLVHGANWKAASALGGTLVSLVASAVLAWAAIGTTHVRGLGDDSNLLIQLYLPTVSVAGLMLAGFIIGTLGALNDATVAQASTVAELVEANPAARPKGLFASAMRVGQDHIASMVYTLVLAYIGAALPMTLLLSVVDRPLMQVLTSDVVATELVRSAVGALGLTLAVPATTLIAASTLSKRQAITST